jgi:hypothetical protein
LGLSANEYFSRSFARVMVWIIAFAKKLPGNPLKWPALYSPVSQGGLGEETGGVNRRSMTAG